MQINVSVEDVTLDTVVCKTLAWDSDEQEMVETGDTRVVDLVAAEIVKKVVADDRYPKLRDYALTVRSEVIREKVGPMVDEVLAGQVRQTNTYGEAKGPEITFRELVMAEVKKAVNESPGSYNNRGNGSVLEIAVRAEVKKVVNVVVVEEVAKMGDLVRQQVAEGMTESAIAAVIASALKKPQS